MLAGAALPVPHGTCQVYGEVESHIHSVACVATDTPLLWA